MTKRATKSASALVSQAESSVTPVEALRELLDAIPASEVTTPRIPVSEATEEAFVLHKYVTENAQVRESLEQVGMPSSLIEDVKLRADALSELQITWGALRPKSRTNEDDALLKSAYAMRSEVLTVVSFHLSQDRRAQELIQIIRRGEGHTDLMEDLRMLARLIEDHLPAFERDKTFDAPAVARALHEMFVSLLNMLGDELTNEQSTQALDRRNRAAVLLQQSMSELRSFGRFTFRKDPARLAHFIARYERELRRARSRRSTTTSLDDTLD